MFFLVSTRPRRRRSRNISFLQKRLSGQRPASRTIHFDVPIRNNAPLGEFDRGYSFGAFLDIKVIGARTILLFYNLKKLFITNSLENY